MVMEKQKFCCEAAAARATKQLTLQDGSQVGIVNLDAILREVGELKLPDTEVVRRELLGRVEAYNYVPAGAEYDYSTALLREYRRRLEKP